MISPFGKLMKSKTENSLINQLRQLMQNGTLCNGNYPTIKLSLCATKALHEFINIQLCRNMLTSHSRNYDHLCSILNILVNQRSLLAAFDSALWQRYRSTNSKAPANGHQIAGLAKALVRGGFYP